MSPFLQHFRWPHYGKVIKHEVLSVSVYNCSKVFSNRSVYRSYDVTVKCKATHINQ